MIIAQDHSKKKSQRKVNMSIDVSKINTPGVGGDLNNIIRFIDVDQVKNTGPTKSHYQHTEEDEKAFFDV